MQMRKKDEIPSLDFALRAHVAGLVNDLDSSATISNRVVRLKYGKLRDQLLFYTSSFAK